MLRRKARLRREYLYRKGLESKEKAVYERKKRLKEAIRAGKKIPTELREEEATLRREIELEDSNTAKPKSHIDDEYANAGKEEPRILLTTSRDPSARLRQFAKELRLVFPNAQRINRGGYIVSEIVDFCRANDMTDLVVVHEHRGEPDGIIISHLPYGPTAYFGISNCTMRHDIPDIGPASEAYPHLIFENFSSSLGERVSNILKYLFPVPKDDSKRVITFSNRNDIISFRHHAYTKKGKEVELTEVGPRFDLRLYQLLLGTMEQKEAEKEWVLRPYMNSSKKRKL